MGMVLLRIRELNKMSESLYRKIAEDIENKVRTGELSVYDKLPSERFMSEDFGVSRNVVRESLKMLNEKGIVEIRKGQGCFIKKPTTEDASERVQEAIYYNNYSLDEILDVRSAIELSSVEQIIKLCTKENIDNLKSYYKLMGESFENLSNYAKNDILFHLELVDCSKNKLAKMLVNAINNVTNDKLFKIHRTKSSLTLSQRQHKAMLKAIEKSDLEMLKTALSEHFKGLKNELTNK